jgi:hypothetical protein
MLWLDCAVFRKTPDWIGCEAPRRKQKDSSRIEVGGHMLIPDPLSAEK